MGILLYILSALLTALFIPIGIVFGFIKTIHKRQFFKSLKDVDTKFMSMAVSIDFFGNILCAELFNCIFITKHSTFLFGKRKETISSVLGKNEKNGTLTNIGITLCKIINKLDKNHTLNSIDDIN